jgi:hypothetical protein
MKTIVYSEPGDTVLLEADGHPITCHRNDMVGDSMFFYFQPRATTFVLRQADSVESVVMETTLYIRIAWHLKLLEATCQLWLIPLLVITFSLKLLLREVFMRPNQALDKVVLGQQQLIASHICFFSNTPAPIPNLKSLPTERLLPATTGTSSRIPKPRDLSIEYTQAGGIEMVYTALSSNWPI